MVPVRLSAEGVAAIDAAAKRHGFTRSEVIRIAVAAAFSGEKLEAAFKRHVRIRKAQSEGDRIRPGKE